MSKMLLILFCGCFINICFCQESINENSRAMLDINKLYVLKVSQADNMDLHLEFDLENAVTDETNSTMKALKIYTAIAQNYLSLPIMFVLRQEYQLASWKLPYTSNFLYTSTVVNKTICASNSSSLGVVVSTSSTEEIIFQIQVSFDEEFEYSGLNDSNRFTVSPSTALLRYYNTTHHFLKSSYKLLMLKMISLDTNNLCLMVSVHKILSPKNIYQKLCPSLANSDSVSSSVLKRSSVTYQSMLNKSVIIIDPADYPYGFFLMISALTESSLCTRENVIKPCVNCLVKNVEITIAHFSSTQQYFLAIFVIFALYLVIFLVTFFLSWITFVYKKQKLEGKSKNLLDPYYFEQLEEAKQKIYDTMKKMYPSKDEGKVSEDGEQETQTRGVVEEGLINSLQTMPLNTMLMNVVPLAQDESLSSEGTDITNENIELKDIPKDTENIQMNTLKALAMQTGNIMKISAIPREAEPVDAVDGNIFTDILPSASSLKPESRIPSRLSLSNAHASDLDSWDFCEDVENCAEARRQKTQVYVADLSLSYCKESEELVFQKSGLHIWLLLICGAFYFLPVYQFVKKNEELAILYGEQDNCYFNYLCLRPLGQTNDFNHVFSNIGYILFGILFIFLVFIKRYKYKKFIEKDGGQYSRFIGIPQQYGLYYAMGLALIFEGIGSSCYHICPSEVSFQFDTTFMYIISVLCFLKIYQFRHLDITCKAYFSFFGLSFTLVLEVWGLADPSPFFWFCFITFYIMFCLIFSIYTYNLGLLKMDLKIGKVILIYFYNETLKCIKGPVQYMQPFLMSPLHKSRFYLIVLMNLFNLITAIYFAIQHSPGVSNYLLFIFIANLTLYCFYYIFMKKINGENIYKVVMAYGIASMICGAISVYFFTQKLKTTKMTPAQSRNLNQECVFLDFYDSHDVWHFMSAAALFFAFMMLLSLDDDLKYTARDKIKVF